MIFLRLSILPSLQKSLEPIINSVSFNCDVIVNGLQVLRLEHQLVCQTISYRSQAVSIEEPWIHLYSLSNVVESNYFDNLYDADVCGDKITMQYIVLEEYEGLAVLLVQKVLSELSSRLLCFFLSQFTDCRAT